MISLLCGQTQQASKSLNVIHVFDTLIGFNNVCKMFSYCWFILLFLHFIFSHYHALGWISSTLKYTNNATPLYTWYGSTTGEDGDVTPVTWRFSFSLWALSHVCSHQVDKTFLHGSDFKMCHIEMSAGAWLLSWLVDFQHLLATLINFACKSHHLAVKIHSHQLYVIIIITPVSVLKMNGSFDGKSHYEITVYSICAVREWKAW